MIKIKNPLVGPPAFQGENNHSKQGEVGQNNKKKDKKQPKKERSQLLLTQFKIEFEKVAIKDLQFWQKEAQNINPPSIITKLKQK